MKPSHYNIYNKVHKKLRIKLLGAGIIIQTTDPDNQEKIRKTLAMLKSLIRAFEDYFAEDAFIFDSVTLTAPFIISQLEKANEKNRQMSELIREKTRQYNFLITPTERTGFSKELQFLFFEFAASVLDNMNKKETVINELLCVTFTVDELETIKEKIIKPQDRMVPASSMVNKARMLATA